MLNFLLFGISFLLIFASSYILAGMLKAKSLINSVLYLILIFVSQVIASIELLSVLKEINTAGILAVNLAVFLISFMFWKKNKFPKISFNLINTLKKINSSLKKDKALYFLLVFFLFASLLSLFFALIVPTNSSDSMAYHLARIGFWIQNESLNHFETNSLRQIVFPINSEILITWSMVFLKKDYLAVMPEYLSYLGCIFTLFGFLRYLKISIRRTLWAILILASLPAVIIESSSTQTNLIVAFFLFSSLYLFIYGAKEQDKKSIIFSALAFAIALGVKSTALILAPVLAIVYLLVSIKEKKKYFYKPIILFSAALIPAFILLSSYNYVLNYMDFGNPFGPPYFIYKHSAPIGIKSFLASLIKYLLLFINFTGIAVAHVLNPIVIVTKNIIFALLGLKTSDGLVYGDFIKISTVVHENYAMFGVLGFLLILPLSIKYGIMGIKFNSKNKFYLCLSGLIIIGFLISLSALMGFCYWYNRFILTAVILGSPILALSYARQTGFLKLIIIAAVIFNYLIITTNNASKPIVWLSKTLFAQDYNSFRDEIRLREDGIMNKKASDYDLINYLASVAPNNSNIGLILSCDDKYYPYFERNLTWKIYSIRYKLLKERKNYNDYDFLIVSGNGQYTDIFERKSLVYNYTVNGKDIIYNQADLKESITLYFDKDAKPVTSNRPFIAFDLIKFEEIPMNFKLIKEFTSDNAKFYVYKKDL